MPASSSVVSLRSPLPLLAGGIGLAVLVVAMVAVLTPGRTTVQSKTATLSDQEALSIVASAIRTGDAAALVVTQGTARFDDGTWYIAVGSSELHFSERHRIVVPDNQDAQHLMFLGSQPTSTEY